MKETSTKPIPAAITYQAADRPCVPTLVAIPVVEAPPVFAANRVQARITGPRDLPAIRKSSLLCFFAAFFCFILEETRPTTTVRTMYRKIMTSVVNCLPDIL